MFMSSFYAWIFMYKRDCKANEHFENLYLIYLIASI